jgi:hypothetical protein
VLSLSAAGASCAAAAPAHVNASADTPTQRAKAFIVLSLLPLSRLFRAFFQTASNPGALQR